MEKGKQPRIFVLKSPRKILSSPEAQLTPRCIIRDNYRHRKPNLNQKDAATTIIQTNLSTHHISEQILVGMKASHSGNKKARETQSQFQHKNRRSFTATDSVTVQNNVSRHSQELVNKFPSPQLTRLYVCLLLWAMLPPAFLFISRLYYFQ